MQPTILHYAFLIASGILMFIGFLTVSYFVTGWINTIRKQRRCSYCGRRWF